MNFYAPDGDHYQINRAAQAFNDGGWLGVGPGEGKVKNAIPDVHNDFIFSGLGRRIWADGLYRRSAGLHAAGLARDRTGCAV